MASDLICVLLCIAAVGECLGTITVWGSYRRGTRVAEELRDEMRAELAELASLGVRQGMYLGDEIMAPLRVTELEKKFRTVRARVADQLAANWVTPAGLAALIVGAVAGLGAGLVALYR